MATTRRMEGAAISGSSFARLCQQFEDEYGHGWKRRMAEDFGVPESSVHTWIRLGRAPSWAMRLRSLEHAWKIREEQIRDHNQSFHVIKTGDLFSLIRFSNGVGEVIASNIPTLELATEFSSLPRLELLAQAMGSYLADYRSDDPEACRLREELGSWSRPSVLKWAVDDETLSELAKDGLAVGSEE